MTFFVSTHSTIGCSQPGLSPQDAALRHATHAASLGHLPHGVPVEVEVQTSRTTSVTVTVTPTGRSWGSLEAPIAQAVAA